MPTAMPQAPIIIEAIIDSDLNKVWNCWTLPEHIIKWNHASDDWHCPAASNDLRTGGKFSATMAAKDGSMSFEFGGIYNTVNHGKLIGFTMSDGRKVEVRFAPEGNKVRVTETFDPEEINSIELQRAGWQAILNNFKNYTESL